MSRKTIILFVLTAGISATVLVFGVPRFHTPNSAEAALQNPGTMPFAGGSADSLKAETEPQPAVPLPDPTPATEPEQDAAVDSSEAQTVAEARPAFAPAPVAPRRILVPVGTTLTVRIAEELGSKISKAGQAFSATLDRDVVIRGRTVIAAGASVTGKIAFAKHAGALTGEPNLQIKLTSINVDNADLAVVTSVQSFGSKIKGKNKVSRFMKGFLKRAVGKEREVVLDDQSVCSFTLQRRLRIQ